MASILDYLQGGSLGQSYIAEDPYWQAGRAISGIQTTAPRNNTEAFLLPFLQNAIGGTLAGYGKNTSAPDTLFKDIQGSSFGEYMPQQYTGVPEGTSIESLLTSQGMPGERPDNLSLKQMSNDLLFASKAKEIAIEQEAKKQDVRDQLEKSLLLDAASKDKISIRQALEGIDNPAILDSVGLRAGGYTQTDIKEDVEKAQRIQQSLDYVDQAAAKAKEANDGGSGAWGAVRQFVGLPPTSEKQTLDRLSQGVIGQKDKIEKRETNSDVRKDLKKEYGFAWYDSDKEIDKKAAEWKEYLKSLKDPTPGLDALGAAKSPQYVIKALPNGQKFRVIVGQ